MVRKLSTRGCTVAPLVELRESVVHRAAHEVER